MAYNVLILLCFFFEISHVLSDPACGLQPPTINTCWGAYGAFWITNNATVAYSLFYSSSQYCVVRFSLLPLDQNCTHLFCPNNTLGGLNDLFLNTDETRLYVATSRGGLLAYDLELQNYTRVDLDGENVTGYAMAGVWVNPSETLAYVSGLAPKDSQPKLLTVDLTTGYRTRIDKSGVVSKSGYYDLWVDESIGYVYLTTLDYDDGGIHVVNLTDGLRFRLTCGNFPVYFPFQLPPEYVWANNSGLYLTNGVWSSTGDSAILIYQNMITLDCSFWEFPLDSLAQFQMTKDLTGVYVYDWYKNAFYNLSLLGTCDAGTYGNPDGSCSPCPKGQYLPPAAFCSLQCLYCDAGQIANKTGSVSCTNCSMGSEDDYLHTECTLCPKGKYNNINGGSCMNCYPGTYSDIFGAVNCKPCPPGETSQFGNTTCWSSGDSGGKEFDIQFFLIVFVPIVVVLGLIGFGVFYWWKKKQSRQTALDVNYEQLRG